MAVDDKALLRRIENAEISAAKKAAEVVSEISLSLPNLPVVSILDNDGSVLDRQWATQAFLVSDNNMDPASNDHIRRYWSSANTKFTDTRVGCNFGINPRPQFTRYCDVRVKGTLSSRKDVTIGNTSGNFGMGRYYSEAIDDPSQVIYLRFGVPQHSGLASFLTNAFDGASIGMAKTGRSSLAYGIGKFFGSAVAAYTFPVFAAAVVLTGLARTFFSQNTSRYYTLKPTMHVYWGAVNTLVNSIAVNKGIFPKVIDFAVPTVNQVQGTGYKIDQDTLNNLHDLMPDVFTSNNIFDMYALANKAQSLANRIFLKNYNDFKNDVDTAADKNLTGIIQKEGTGDGRIDTNIHTKEGNTKIFAWLNKALMFSANNWGAADTPDAVTQNADISEMNPKEIHDRLGDRKSDSWIDQYQDYFDSEARDGAQYAVFKVDHTGSVQESFSNSTTESGISQKINSIAQDARHVRFNFADGNVSDSKIWQTISGIVGAAAETVMGAVSGVTFGASDILIGLAGNGYIDIPKTYDNSQAQLAKSSYKIQLVSPYGNPISLIQNIYIPLCMLLAGVLPRSTGKQSYTSPFLCELYDRGRTQVKLGIMDSLSITRGTSTLPFNLKGDALAIDVDFSILDLSNIMHMPLPVRGIFGSTNLEEDNILTDYLAVIAGQDIYSQIYALPRARLRLAKMVSGASMLASPAYWASASSDFLTSGALNWITGPAYGLMQGAVVGTGNVTKVGNAG